MKKLIVTALTAALTTVAAVATASPFVFTTSGASVAGKASFEQTSATTFTVTLENLTHPVQYTAQELDGLTFRIDPSSNPALVGVSVQGIIQCDDDHGYPCDTYMGALPVNDGWGVSTTAGLTNLKPDGYHPFAIINPDYVLPNNGNGNLANGEHNPFLIGPVVFTFNGTFTDVSDVTFFWGTRPDSTTGILTDCPGCPQQLAEVPEPATLMLFGSGLLAGVHRLRRRSKNQQVS